MRLIRLKTKALTYLFCIANFHCINRKAVLLFFCLLPLFNSVNGNVTSTTGNVVFDSNNDGISELLLNMTGLGIGTTSPSTNLHVNGNVFLSNKLGVGLSSPSHALHLSGTLGFRVQNISSNVTLSNNSVLLVNTNGMGNLILELPQASTVTGRKYNIKKANSSNIVNVLAPLDLGIDGNLGYEMTDSTNGFPFLEVISNGSGWYILNKSSDGVILGVSSSNLLGYWKLDETSGTIANNLSSSANGTLSGGLDFSINGTSGKVSRALDLNGSSHYIDVTNSSLLNPTHVTVSVWVYIHSYPVAYPRVVAKDSAVGDAGQAYHMIVHNNGKVFFRINNSGWKGGDFDTSLSLNTWYHLVGTFDGSEVKAYINGVQEATTYAFSGTIDTSDGDNLTIGFQPGSSNYFDGLIDDVRIYDYALSLSQIQGLYQLGN